MVCPVGPFVTPALGFLLFPAGIHQVVGSWLLSFWPSAGCHGQWARSRSDFQLGVLSRGHCGLSVQALPEPVQSRTLASKQEELGSQDSPVQVGGSGAGRGWGRQSPEASSSAPARGGEED